MVTSPNRLLLLFVLLLPALPACTSSERAEGAADDPAAAAIADSARVADSLAKANAVPDTAFAEIRYTHLPITSRRMIDSLRKVFARSKEESDVDPHRILVTLNRKEFGYIRVGDTIVVPNAIVPDMRAYSVFPMRYPAADTIAKLIVVSNAMQAYACYEHGRLIRFAACNTGTESKPTLPGRYALNWKERLRISSLNDNWKLPYTWNFHLYAGNAFHQFAMPGRPVSHSCVRQFMTDAKWLFDWGAAGYRDTGGHVVQFTGTPVIIIDVFDWTRKKGGPWLDLASNRDGMLKLPDNPMGMEEALIPISQVPRDARGALKDRQRYVTAEDTLRARGIIRPEARLSASIDYNALREARQRRSASRTPRRSSSGADGGSGSEGSSNGGGSKPASAAPTPPAPPSTTDGAN